MTPFDFDNFRRKISPLFLITVIIPTAIAILYFALFASDVYISESRFVVRTPEKPAASALGVVLKSAGFTNSNDEISAAQSAVISRDALHSLNAHGAFAKSYSDGSISLFDRFGSLGFGDSFEELYKYFKKRVSLERDPGTAISILTVRAYAPADAQRFNESLLEMAEATVNRLNARGREDMIRFAAGEVDAAKAQARQTALALAAYRNRSGVVDPEKQAAVQGLMISRLQDELIETQTKLQQMRNAAPDNPQIPALATRAAKLSAAIGEQQGQVAGTGKSLAGTQAQYQQLLLDSEIADKQLTSALNSLEEARNEAGRKQAYVERIVQPNLPDAPLEPRRWRGILATLAIGLVAYGVASMLLAGLREHQD